MKKLLFLCFISKAAFASNDSLRNAIAMQGSYTSGNFNNYSLGLRTDSKFTNQSNNLEFSTIGKFTKVNYILREKEAYSNFTYSYTKTNKKILIFTENESSYLRKINWRGSIGLGYGYKFINKKDNLSEISEALMPERINFNYSPKLDSLNFINLTSVRLSTKLKLILTKSNFKFSFITLIQPPIWNSINIGWSDNMIIRNSTSISVLISKSLQLGIVDDYVMNTYPANVLHIKKPYDNSMNFFIKMNF